MKQFFEFFAQRHTLANLFVIMVIVLGLNTFTHIKRDLFPEVDFGMVMITTVYPGASPEDVELNVTNKIEEELKNLTGIERSTSLSMENVSVITVVIDPDALDQDKVKNDIREAVGRVTELPEEVTGSPHVEEISTADVQVIEVGITGDLPYREFREYARLFEKKLKNVPGVSRVTRFGIRAREIKVEVSPRAIKNYQIPLREIIWAVQARNIRATAGNLESYTSEKNVVTLAQFRDPLEVGDVTVRSTFEGPLIKVKNLAVVKDDFEDERVVSRMMGKKAISFVVFKEEAADIIRTVDAVKGLVERERENLPEGAEMHFSGDLSKQVRNRFQIVRTNGLIGLVIVVAVLTIFVGFRTSFWVAMGIPVSLLGVTFLLPLFGASLNSASLSAMIIVIGIIVDDGIIVAENIYRHRERGEPPLTAAVEGIREVFGPVVTTVLTTFLVFAPMFFMTGLFGKFIFVIPLVVSLSLFISLIEVVLALPAHLLRGLRQRPHTHRHPLSGWFDLLRTHYQRAVTRFLRFRYLLVAVFVVVLFVSFWVSGKVLKFILFPTKMATDFYVLAELPIGTSLQATSDKMREVEEIVSALPEDELESFVTRIGLNPSINAESENYASMWVTLTPYAERVRIADEIVEDLRQRTDKLEGFEEITYVIESGGPPVGRPINIQIVGSDDAMRKELADSVEAFVKTIDGAKDIERDDKQGKDQVEIKVNYDKLARMGLTMADVAQNVRIAYDGEVVTSVRYGDEDVDFRVLFEEEARKRLDYMKRLPVPNRRGRLIPLSEVARLETGPGPADYRHYNGERVTTIEGDVNQDVVTPLEVNAQVFEHFNLDRDWPGMRFELGGEAFETQKSMASLMRTFIIAVVGVYFLLVVLFNSFTQPLMVMAAIPFAIVGVIIAFMLHGEPMSFMGMLGVIGLAGVVVNDSLVLVSHLNDLKRNEERKSFLEMVGEGTGNRLRPIILTTLTTAAGLLPLAYGWGGTDVFIAPMALALGYGLIFATPLTLVLVPCLYVIQNDFGTGVHRLFRRDRRMSELSESPPANEGERGGEEDENA
jgi:multidrug efflux pump subunit AcrB